MVESILIIVMLVGIVLIGISLKMSISKEQHVKTPNYLEIENTIRAIDTSINEADQAIENINKLSQSVFDEFEQKYQEILFLYSMIDEKKKDIDEIYNRPIPQEIQKINEDVNEDEVTESKINPQSYNAMKNPNFEQVLKLYDEGMDMTEIAKTLDIGQGEVQLILGLGKR